MNILLLPLSWLYGVVVAARNAAFDSGLLHQANAGVPVIAVGNMTAGGTGKTPLTAYIVRALLQRGRKPAVISRGYGRSSHGVVIVAGAGRPTLGAAQGGDEPVEIARSFPGVPVVVGERRVDAAAVAVRECGADVVVMDDGFQHRYLRRNADIVMLDARQDIRRIAMLPAGRRREWLRGIQRASLLMFSRCGAEGLPAWSRELASGFRGGIAGCRFRTAGFRSVPDGADVRPQGPVIAFSGIGDHAEFLRTISEAGVTVCADRRFADHHPYTLNEIAGIVALARTTGAAGIMTTEKDMVRLDGDPAVAAVLLQGPPVMTATLRVDVTVGNDAFESTIARCLQGGGR